MDRLLQQQQQPSIAYIRAIAQNISSGQRRAGGVSDTDCCCLTSLISLDLSLQRSGPAQLIRLAIRLYNRRCMEIKHERGIELFRAAAREEGFLSLLSSIERKI